MQTAHVEIPDVELPVAESAGSFIAYCVSRKLPSRPHSTQAPLRHYLGYAQERYPKWFRQVSSAPQVSGVLQTEMSTLREDSDREQFRATPRT